MITPVPESCRFCSRLGFVVPFAEQHRVEYLAPFVILFAFFTQASAGGVGMSRRGGFSTESFDPRMARRPSGLHRREASEGPEMRRGGGATDPRKQFSRLKSTAFIG